MTIKSKPEIDIHAIKAEAKAAQSVSDNSFAKIKQGLYLIRDIFLDDEKNGSEALINGIEQFEGSASKLCPMEGLFASYQTKY